MRKGENSPFHGESGVPGYCQVTVGWSLERIINFLHVGFFKRKGKTRQNDESELKYGQRREKLQRIGHCK